MTDASDLEPDDDRESEDDEFSLEIVTQYESHTERLRVYAEILRVAKSRGRDDYGDDCGSDSELCVDLISARNLAELAVWRDIRRIAGDGRPVFDAEVN